ncbi:MAG TPA: hypothetical protein VF737_00405 [Gemmatimonadaceae bacterium]
MRKRRVFRIAVVAALVLAQGVALTTGASCVCDPASVSSMPSMPGGAMPHSMPGMPAPGHHAPCSQPMAPGACVSMGACRIVAVAAAAQRPASAMPAAALAVAPVLQPPGNTSRAPEPPPPRV